MIGEGRRREGGSSLEPRMMEGVVITKEMNCHLALACSVQGDTSHCSLGSIEFKSKVAF